MPASVITKLQELAVNVLQMIYSSVKAVFFSRRYGLGLRAPSLRPRSADVEEMCPKFVRELLHVEIR